MNQSQKLLIVEDDSELRALLEELFGKVCGVVSAADGEEAIRVAARENPEVVLMDIRMPKVDGLHACEAIRAQVPRGRGIQVVFLSGQDDEKSRIEAFERGADDFIGKPVGDQELFARVISKFRRQNDRSRNSRVIKTGPLELDLDRLDAKIGESRLSLSVLEFNLLKFMVENEGIVLSREQILKAIWPDVAVSERTVDAHISSIRRHLKPFETSLKTVYGAGYLLNLRR